MKKLSSEEIRRRNEARIVRGQTITDPDELKRRRELTPQDDGTGLILNAVQEVIDEAAARGKRRDLTEAILALAELIAPEQAVTIAERLAVRARDRIAEANGSRNGVTPSSEDRSSEWRPTHCSFPSPFSLSSSAGNFVPRRATACRNRYSIWPLRLRNSSSA